MSLPYYKRFPRDFLEGTIGLSFEEKGAYAIVLDLIYMRDGSLPDDARYIAGQLGCSVRKWSALLERLVSAGKLKVENGLISNFRADYILEETRKYRNKQAETAGIPRKNNNLRKPEQSQPEPEPEPDKTEGKPSVVHERPKKPSEPIGDFDSFWDRFPLKVSKVAAAKAYKSAIRKLDHESLVRHLDHQIRCGVWDGQFRLHASTWLNQERWNDVVEPRRFAGMAGQPAPGYRGRQDTSLAEIAARRQRERDQGMAVPGGQAAVSGDDLGWSDGAIDGELFRSTGEG